MGFLKSLTLNEGNLKRQTLWLCKQKFQTFVVSGLSVKGYCFKNTYCVLSSLWTAVSSSYHIGESGATCENYTWKSNAEFSWALGCEEQKTKNKFTPYPTPLTSCSVFWRFNIWHHQGTFLGWLPLGIVQWNVLEEIIGWEDKVSCFSSTSTLSALVSLSLKMAALHHDLCSSWETLFLGTILSGLH
jgi:hypothetical protein